MVAVVAVVVVVVLAVVVVVVMVAVFVFVAVVAAAAVGSRCLLGLQLHGWLKNQRSWNLHSFNLEPFMLSGV